MTENHGKDTTLKTVGTLALVFVGFILLYNLLLGGGSGFDLNNLLPSVILLAVRLLWVVFIISLVIGLVVLGKKHLGENKIDLSFLPKFFETGCVCPCCGTKVGTEYKFCPSCKAELKGTCKNCGKSLEVGWKHCPNCGTSKTTDA